MSGTRSNSSAAPCTATCPPQRKHPSSNVYPRRGLAGAIQRPGSALGGPMHDLLAAGRLPSLASGTPADRLLGLNALDGARAAVTFYATIDADSVRDYMPAVPVLLPASSWARYGLRTPRLPDHVTE